MERKTPALIKTTVNKEITWTPSTEWIITAPPSHSPGIKKYEDSPPGPGNYSSPDREVNTLLFGVIFLIFIIISTMLISITSSLYATGSPQGIVTTNQIASSSPLAVSLNPALPDTIVYPNSPGSMNNQIPKTPPPGNSATSLPDPVLAVIPAAGPSASEIISRYVTIEPKAPIETENHVFLQPSIPQGYGEGYVTIYSLTDQNISQVLPLISFSLHNPPLVIDYNFTPLSRLRLKHVEYKMMDTYYEENLEISRAYEDAWFKIIVRNKDTGEIVSEDGIGRTYSFQTPKQLVVREGGNYSVEFTGNYGVLDLTTKVKQEGNFP